MGVPDYTPKQITSALQALARHNGDLQATADDLIDEAFMVEPIALQQMLDEHPEQYAQAVRVMRAEREGQAASMATEIIKRGGEIELALLEELALIKNPNLLPQVMRAVTYSRSKNTTILMQLTGRPVDGKQDASTDAMSAFVQAMAERGLIAIAPEVAATLGPGDVQEEKG